MSAPKRSKQQREEDFNTLSTLYVKRVSQVEIAAMLGVSQGQVSQDIKQLLQKWGNTQLDRIDRYKNEQLAKIDAIEDEMWEQWKLSKQQGKKTLLKSTSGEVKKKVVNNNGDGLQESVNKEPKNWRNLITEESAKGDMEYMRGIMWCYQERAKIIGLYAPKKIASTNPEGDKEAGQAAREELMKLIQGVADKFNPSNNNPEEKVIDVEAREIESELPKILKEERLKGAPPPIIPVNPLRLRGKDE